MQTTPTIAPRSVVRQEGGFAMLVAVFALLLLGGIIMAGTDEALSGRRSAHAVASNPARAREIASAGLADALSWFRRQRVQPVGVFAPARDLAADPPVNETDDPSIGLVREYEIAPSLWARYEVRVGTAAETYTDTNANGYFDDGEPFTDADGDGTWDRAAGTRDISALRGEVASGTVWLIESHGFIFARPDDSLPLGQGHNTRLAVVSIGTEIRRMAIAPPSAAAICAAQGGNVVLGNRSRIRGGLGAGVAYAESTGVPTREGGSEVVGSPSTTSVPGYDGDLKAIFGLDLTQLKSMADLSTMDARILPGDLGEFTLTVVEDDVVFDAARPLRGTGVVVIQGSCAIVGGSNSFFNGLLWVRDDLSILAPVYLRGLCVSEGSVDVRGTGGDYSELDYDDKIIDDLLVRMGRYRRSKSLFVLGDRVPGASGGTP